jgi:hypothetical protein
MFDPYWGVELRTTMGNLNDPVWATVSLGLVIKPKKKFLGLFGKNNDLEKPTPATLPPVRRRLAAERATDELVVAFKRLTIERRTRLLAFLADPRRGRI